MYVHVHDSTIVHAHTVGICIHSQLNQLPRQEHTDSQSEVAALGFPVLPPSVSYLAYGQKYCKHKATISGDYCNRFMYDIHVCVLACM